jgi:hypothetical protein
MRLTFGGQCAPLCLRSARRFFRIDGRRRGFCNSDLFQRDRDVGHEFRVLALRKHHGFDDHVVEENERGHGRRFRR